MSQWISVEQGLPKMGERILEYQDNGDSENFFCVIWDKSELKYYKMNNITHWKYVNPPLQSTHTQQEIDAWDHPMDN